jgi:phenylpropionate dioxygenase-like ring-hydroxylating dioxygenase large terminal subunit
VDPDLARLGEDPFELGPEEQVAEPGDFFTRTVRGVGILVTRDDQGRVHALLNVCRHRGVQLVFAERGNARGFICVQHAWAYDLCGGFGGAPRDDRALVEIPCAVDGGVIWLRPGDR